MNCWLQKKEYQIRGRRSGRKQVGLHKETTPTSEGWKALQLICVVFCFNFSSKYMGEPKIVLRA